LTKVVSNKSSGIPKVIVENCHGIAIVSVVEVGAIISGTKGSGIIMAKNPAVSGHLHAPVLSLVLDLGSWW
jgi:lipid-binding SYLF domain-containing protein